MCVELSCRADPGIVDDQVECPESLLGQVEEPSPIGFERQVGRGSDDPFRLGLLAEESLRDRVRAVRPSGRSGSPLPGREPGAPPGALPSPDEAPGDKTSCVVPQLSRAMTG